MLLRDRGAAASFTDAPSRQAQVAGVGGQACSLEQVIDPRGTARSGGKLTLTMDRGAKGAIDVVKVEVDKGEPVIDDPFAK